ncbi:hypothetical protein EMEDMD4_160044 [Sinorhizobium medicae]|uniref:Uncharacterized protein n=1 Tax=Sinorhizobium medicae TaxID=110321 RepID=A0A508WXP1_9HYPH|nr:hypothetical protein EMEDMD4_160044 [Sinorhizobium medicae]
MGAAGQILVGKLGAISPPVAAPLTWNPFLLIPHAGTLSELARYHPAMERDDSA